MSRAGRKRKSAPRFPSGKIKIKRPTMTELAELERQSRQTEMHVVLQQHHRRGDTHQWRGSVLGRFVLDHKLRPEFFDAGNEYNGLVRRLWAAKGVPTDVKCGERGTGEGPSDITVRKWEKDELRIRTALMRRHSQCFLCVRRVAVDDREIQDEMAAFLIQALQIIAVEFGLMREGDHPFA